MGRVFSRAPKLEFRRSPSESYMKEFRNEMPSMRYDSVFMPTQECSICLAEFEHKAETNRLSCGHIFHESCLNYWNTTCPLCRTRMMPQEIGEVMEQS